MNEYKELGQLILQYKDIIIHRHKRPDFDSIGSQMGLKEVLQINFPEKNIYAVGDDGFLEFSHLGEIDFVREDIYKKALVIIVDTANYARIEDERHKLAETLVKIDHHEDVLEERFGQLNIVVSHASSTCELLVDIIQALDWKMSGRAAYQLFNGIYADTGGFVFPNTSVKTFEKLAYLRQFDWDYEEAMNELRVYDYKLINLVGYAYQNVVIDNGVGYMKFDRPTQLKLGCNASDVSVVVNFLGTIKELEKWVVFNDYGSFIRLNFRSRKKYDVASIAKMFGGGGHKNAAGGSIDSWDAQEDVIQLLKDLDSAD